MTFETVLERMADIHEAKNADMATAMNWLRSCYSGPWCKCSYLE
jgi:hypothetical protein